MYCTNCHKINHKIETCRVKTKKDLVLANFEVIIQHINVQRPIRYSCYICGDIRHKIINCPKYSDI
jgi:hypothetical protein